jgi:hypothetical protein
MMCDSCKCVACGARIEGGYYSNHHCSPESEKRRQTREKKANQDYANRKPTEAMRINYGFYLLSLRGS